MNIRIVRYTFNSKYNVISTDLITKIDKPSDYEYWNSKVILMDLIPKIDKPRDYEYWNCKI